MVEVNQADRDLAGDLISRHAQAHAFADEVRQGRADAARTVQDVARHRLATLHAEKPSDGVWVPDGYVSVPREPTEAMLKVGRQQWWRGVTSLSPAESMKAVWFAMVDAAP